MKRIEDFLNLPDYSRQGKSTKRTSVLYRKPKIVLKKDVLVKEVLTNDMARDILETIRRQKGEQKGLKRDKMTSSFLSTPRENLRPPEITLVPLFVTPKYDLVLKRIPFKAKIRPQTARTLGDNCGSSQGNLKGGLAGQGVENLAMGYIKTHPNAKLFSK